MQLQFEHLNNPIFFDGCDELAEILLRVLRGWRVSPALEPSAPALIRIMRGPGGFERTSPWLEGGAMVLADPVDAVCDLLLDMERAFIADTGKLLALHAASVEFDGTLTVFPSTHEAGKSVLSVLLAKGGGKIFADDVTPLNPGTGGNVSMAVSPGLLPRLRLPLPDDLDASSVDFINSHHGPKSESFLYVDVDENLMAPLNTSAPIKRIVLLERETGAKPEIIPATNSEVLKQTIVQSLGLEISAIEMIDTLNAIVAGAECLRLRYERTEDAANMIEQL